MSRFHDLYKFQLINVNVFGKSVKYSKKINQTLSFDTFLDVFLGFEIFLWESEKSGTK